MDSKIKFLWTRNATEIFTQSKLFPHLKVPIYLHSTVETLRILDTYDETITEGEPFERPFKIQVLDTKDEPVKNQLVFAVVSSYGELDNYNYRQRLIGWENKHLIFPMPAKYSGSALDPCSLDEIIFKPILTDNNGTVTFDDLKFSIRGPHGRQSTMLK